MLSRLKRLALLSLALGAPLAAQEQVDHAEIIRGRVFASDSLPVQEAIVTVTGVRSGISKTTRTDHQGLYTVIFANPEGDYLVTILYVGFAPQTHRVTSRGAMGRLLVQDVRLAVVPYQLDTVKVIGVAGRNPRLGDGLSVGGKEQDVLGGKLFSLDPSDLNTLAASVPGILLVPGAHGRSGGFSVLGLPPGQNAITVDGSTFGGSALPQDAIAGATAKTTTYDPSQGRFSGGQLAITTRSGNDRFTANMRGTVMPSALSWADPAAVTPLPSISSLGGSVGGPIRPGKAFYFGAFESDRYNSDRMSLLDPNEFVLAQRGIARDTVNRLAGSLARLAVPLTSAAIPDGQVNTSVFSFARIDLVPTATSSMTLGGNGTRVRNQGIGISALGFPAQGTGGRSDNLGFHVKTAAYFRGYLTELKTEIQRFSISSGPYVFLPSGDVRFGTTYDDGRSGLTSINFGGGNAPISSVETRRWTMTHELSRITLDSRHHLKFGQELILGRARSYVASDPFGRFSYASLSDLEANLPASFSRTLDSRERSSRGLEGAVWLGDEWRRGQRLRVETGIRVDVARSGTRPMYNAVVDSLFGLRTDAVPGSIGYSPRLGFSWVMRPSAAKRSALTLTGGLGAFRGVINPAQVAVLSDVTGLPNTSRTLTCVGDATPIPDWALYTADPDAIPVACLDGGGPIEFSEDRPRVSVYDRNFRPSLSWRGNLTLGGLTLGDWPVSIEATQQVGFNGESAIDENLRRTPVFTLVGEAERPVFVAPTSIVSSTGEVAPAAARISERFGSVLRNVSDLRNVATQLTASLAPPGPLFGKVSFNASYTFTYNRGQERGFNGSTAGDPFLLEWAEGTHPTHQIASQASITIKWIMLGLQTNIYSGAPYTPMVAGDVNGDGMGNDRAFIFDPAMTSDPALASEMRALLDAAPARARECLAAQAGRVAARNSCSTGWRIQPDISLNFQLPTNGLPTERNVSLWDRLALSVKADNIVGALLRLADLEIPSGWGRDRTAPDQTLLHVQGFDPATQQFRYRINQQFGDIIDRASTRRNRLGGGAFRVQLGGELKFGGPSQRAMAERLGFIPSPGEPALTVERAKDLLRQQTSDPLGQLLARRDSLVLTTNQLALLGALSRELRTSVDSAIAPLAEYIVNEGRKLKDTELQKRLAKLFPVMRAVMRDALVRALGLLTDEQRARVPEIVRLADSDSSTR